MHVNKMFSSVNYRKIVELERLNLLLQSYFGSSIKVSVILWCNKYRKNISVYTACKIAKNSEE